MSLQDGLVGVYHVRFSPCAQSESQCPSPCAYYSSFWSRRNSRCWTRIYLVFVIYVSLRSLTIYFRDTNIVTYTFTTCSLSRGQTHIGSLVFNAKAMSIERIHFPIRWCALYSVSLKLRVHGEFARWRSRHVSCTHSLGETSVRIFIFLLCISILLSNMT